MKIFFLSFALLLTTLGFAKEHTQQLKKLNTKGFDVPVALVFAPETPAKLFVVEQPGVIQHVDKNDFNKTAVFLDIKSLIDYGGEKGLLGLAFHPKFKQNGRFFLNYTAQVDNKLKTVIAEWKANPTTLAVDLKSEKRILMFDQPASNHNGGTLVFGNDGQLYIASGDGGFGGDPNNNAQNLKSLLGKILRLNVDKTPIVPEVYAYGLRNPWKISFDYPTNELWAADVGQDKWEEINVIIKGGNYGWRIKEGNHCFNPATDCNQARLINPVFEYARENNNCSVTGGYIYRGKRFAELVGSYIYGDFCSGKVWAFNPKTKANKLLLESGLAISSFGVDQEGEIYVLDHTTGGVFNLI